MVRVKEKMEKEFSLHQLILQLIFIQWVNIFRMDKEFFLKLLSL